MATRDLIVKIDEAAYVRLVAAARAARMTPSEYGWTLMEKGRLADVQPGAMNVVNLSADLGPVLAKLDLLSTAVAALSRPVKQIAPDLTKVEAMFTKLLDAVMQANALPVPAPVEPVALPAPPKDPIDALMELTPSQIRLGKAMRAAGSSLSEIARATGGTTKEWREILR